MPAGWALRHVGVAGPPSAAAAYLKRDPNMLHDAKDLRRATAMAIRRQPGLATLPRTMAVLLSVWLVYFFAVNLFVNQLNAVTVPYVEAPLRAYLVMLGAVLVFAAAVWLLVRAIGSKGARAK
jgi:putative solute:sodium symporter small subunit